MRVYIRERRMERHLTQGQLAERLVNNKGKPLNQSDLSKYERGETPPPLDIILQIAEILNCKMEDLVSRH